MSGPVPGEGAPVVIRVLAFAGEHVDSRLFDEGRTHRWTAPRTGWYELTVDAGGIRGEEIRGPAVGQVAHYVSYGTPGGEYRSECRAATVSEVDPSDPDRVGLVVLNPTGLFFRPLGDGGCAYHGGDVGHGHADERIPARSYPGGTWHWPEDDG